VLRNRKNTRQQGLETKEPLVDALFSGGAAAWRVPPILAYMNEALVSFSRYLRVVVVQVSIGEKCRRHALLHISKKMVRGSSRNHNSAILLDYRATMLSAGFQRVALFVRPLTTDHV
jgi:hypothetical protein